MAARPKTVKSSGSSITSPGSNPSSNMRASSSAISRAGSSTVSTTVLRSTMRISPLESSISTSACTVGPYFFASAAMKPSCSSPYSSARSSCFEFESSRNAANISAELTILDLAEKGIARSERPENRLFEAKRQPGLLDRGERNPPRLSPSRTEGEHGPRLTPHPLHDLGLDPSSRLGREDVRPPTHEPAPFGRRPQRTFTGRRHLQHIPFSDHRTVIEPSFERA